MSAGAGSPASLAGGGGAGGGAARLGDGLVSIEGAVRLGGQPHRLIDALLVGRREALLRRLFQEVVQRQAEIAAVSRGAVAGRLKTLAQLLGVVALLRLEPTHTFSFSADWRPSLRLERAARLGAQLSQHATQASTPHRLGRLGSSAAAQRSPAT